MAFTNEGNPELIAKSATLLQVYTPEFYAHLVSLIPKPEQVQENHNNCAASYAALLAGDPEKAKEFEAHRQALNEGLTLLLGLGKAVGVKDPKVPEALRLSSVSSKTTNAKSLSRPTDFKVTYTPDGHLLASVSKVASARGYQVWGCDEDPNVEANWRMVASSPSCRGIVITIDRSKNNWLKIRAMKGKGVAGPWSNIINMSSN